jgi:hypothetical protein
MQLLIFYIPERRNIFDDFYLLCLGHETAVNVQRCCFSLSRRLGLQSNSTGGTIMTAQNHEPVFACRMDAIPQEHRAGHKENIQRVFASIQEVRELPTGYALRLPNETDLLQTIVAFLSYERLCCPFFHFGLEIEPEQGPIWLRLTGTRDVKPFLQSQGFSPSSGHSHA